MKARPETRSTWIICAILLGFAAAGCGPQSNSKPEAPRAATPAPTRHEPPNPDVATLEPGQAAQLRTAREAVLAHPESADAWGTYGQVCEANDFAVEAGLCYARAVELAPDSGRWLHLLGLQELALKPDSALVRLSRAAELVGTNSDAPRIRWVQALNERGRFEEAARGLQPLLLIRPDHPAARLELARVSLSTNGPAAAVELLTPCLTNPYTARPAAMLLSQARLRLGDVEGANALARRAASMPRPFDWPDPFLREIESLRRDRQNVAARANGLLIQRRIPEAEKLLTDLLNTSPDDPEGLLILGRLRLQQSKCTEAEKLIQRHLKVRPDSLNGQVQLGLVLMCQSRWNDAASAFETALRVKPDFAQAHFNLGLARANAGDDAGAVRAFEEAVRCNPGDAAALGNLSELHLRAGRSNQARDTATQALRLDPNQPRARRTLEALTGAGSRR